jgi:hypothetical protein
MVGAAAVLGFALHPMTSVVAPLACGLLGIAIGAWLGYGKPMWRIIPALGACGLLFAFAPDGAASSAWNASPMGLAVLLVAVGAIMGLATGAYGLRGIKGALAVMFGAATMLLAMWSALRIGSAQQTMTWSTWATDTAAAAAMGMIGVIAMLPRHLRVSLDPVQAAIRRLPTELDSEVRELCNRSIAIWNTAKDKLADGDPGKSLVKDGVMKTLEVATKSADVRVAGPTDAELAKRMEDLDQRIASSTDSEVKAQYQAARSALDDQKRYRDHIKQNSERLVARMHNHVAALEKFQLAAGGLVAARAATAGASAVKQLEELSADVAASGEALAELEIGAPVEDAKSDEAKPAEAQA